MRRSTSRRCSTRRPEVRWMPPRAGEAGRYQQDARRHGWPGGRPSGERRSDAYDPPLWITRPDSWRSRRLVSTAAPRAICCASPRPPSKPDGRRMQPCRDRQRGARSGMHSSGRASCASDCRSAVGTAQAVRRGRAASRRLPHDDRGDPARASRRRVRQPADTGAVARRDARDRAAASSDRGRLPPRSPGPGSDAPPETALRVDRSAPDLDRGLR